MFPEAEQLRLNHDHFKDKIILLSQTHNSFYKSKTKSLRITKKHVKAMINVSRRGIFIFLLYIIAPSSVLCTRWRGFIRRGWLFEKRHTDRLKGQYTLLHGTNFSAGGVIFFSPGRDVNTSSAESDSPL